MIGLFNLENEWFIAKDESNEGKKKGYEKAIAESAVPAFVPSIIQQFFPDYHGVAYYWCKFTPRFDKAETDRVLLKFGGADYKAEVWLNGEFLGEDEGGETPFEFEVTDKVKLEQENLLAVRIINPADKTIDGLTLMNIPHRNKEVVKRAGSTLNHGGLWYSVSLEVVPSASIDDYYLLGDYKTGELSLTVTTYSERDLDGTLTLAVGERSGLGGKVGEKSIPVTVKKGKSNHEISFVVPDVKPWSTDNPFLYDITITLSTKYGEHEKKQRFGFREFLVKDGFFYLNGKKIFLKSAHTGNAFPIGQMFPVRPEQIRQDLIYAKASGFNTLRSIAGMFRPEQIDVADEIGLLLYEECFASWCMSYSAIDTWKNSDEFKEMLSRHPSIPVGEESDLAWRWENATAKMVKRDRNRTSIVVWGMLNETFESSIFRTAVAFLPKLRALDTARTVILSSGRWDNDYLIGSVSNPFSNEWEKAFGDEGERNQPIEQHCGVNVGDVHFYPQAPINEEDANRIRTLGQDCGKAKFFSEFGVGAQFNVIEEYKNFVQHGERTDLEDSAWLYRQSVDFERDFYRLGLDKLYPFPESVLKDSQRLNAEERKRIFDLIRSNPKISGYSLTGLLDHGMCGEGLWSYWRRWKPQMFDVVADGWANLRWCLFAPASAYEGEPITLEAVLASDGVLRSGEYNARFAITGKEGVVTTFEQKFTLDANDLATPVIKKEFTLDLTEGEYTFTAVLDEGSAFANETIFHIYDKKKSESEVAVIGANLGDIVKTKPYIKGDNLVFAGSVNPSEALELIASAKEGATLVFLDDNIFSSEEMLEVLRKVVPDMTVSNHRDWLYHKEYLLNDKVLFDGLGDKMMELYRFEGVFPHKSINTAITPDDIVCPGILTGFYGVEGGYGLTYGALGVCYGKGKVYFSTFELLQKIGSPVADRLVYNLIEKLTH